MSTTNKEKSACTYCGKCVIHMVSHWNSAKCMAAKAEHIAKIEEAVRKEAVHKEKLAAELDKMLEGDEEDEELAIAKENMAEEDAENEAELMAEKMEAKYIANQKKMEGEYTLTFTAGERHKFVYDRLNELDDQESTLQLHEKSISDNDTSITRHLNTGNRW